MHEAELLRRLIELERRMAGSERERLQPWEQPLQVHRDQFLPAPEGGVGGAVTGTDNHGPYAALFANAAARLGDSQTYQAHQSAAGGGNPVRALQLDTVTEYYLSAHAPTTWTAFTDVGEANDAANVGVGAGVRRDKSGTTINLRSILGVNDIGSAEAGDEVEIDGAALLPRDGLRPMTGNLDLDGFDILNLGTPLPPAAHAPTHGPATGSDPLETGIAGTIAIGDTAAEGTADDLARSDHRHALPAPAAPADVTKAAASAGAATTAARSDHKHDVTTAAPAAAGVSAASGEGAATMLARSDHTHQSNTAATTIQPDDAAAVGTSGEPARADHKHAIVAAAPAQGVGGGNTEGAATSFARSDHDHTLRETGDPTDLTVGAIPDGHHLIRSGGALIGAEISQRRHFVSERMSGLATFLPTDGTAYWAYIGRTSHAVTLNFVNLRVTTGGSGAQTAEVALASSPLAPNRAAQTLTKIAASGSLDGLTTAGLKRNTVALAAVVPAFTHLWAGVRTSMGGAEPTTSALSRDHGQGELMSTAAAGALTGAGPWTATPLADAAGQCVELRASID